MIEKFYASRDTEGQGDYYLRHVNAMTQEELHNKADIAAELAYRDIKIDRLKKADEASEELCRDLCIRLGAALGDVQRLRQAMADVAEKAASIAENYGTLGAYGGRGQVIATGKAIAERIRAAFAASPAAPGVG